MSLTEKAIREAFVSLPFDNWCEGIRVLLRDRLGPGGRHAPGKSAGVLLCALKDLQEAEEANPRACCDSTTHERGP